MPDPDREVRRLLVDDFLRSVEDEQKRTLYTELLSPLPKLEAVIRARFPTRDGLPELRLITNTPVGGTHLGDMPQQVFLSDGLLDCCVAVGNQTVNIWKHEKIPRPMGWNSVAKIGVMWAYAHEVFHFVRRHKLIEGQFGSDIPTMHALEFDADMCATAVLYRYVQMHTATGRPIQAKRAVLMNLFWHLRAHLDSTTDGHYGSETHPYVAARLLDVVGKLAMLNDVRVPDPNFESTASHQDHYKLVETLFRMEKAYVAFMGQGDPTAIESSLLATFTLKNAELTYTSDRHRRWDEISPFIDTFSTLPRDVVSNEESVAILAGTPSSQHRP